MKELEEIEQKIDELEKKYTGYMEADMNAEANRIKRQIRKLETERELFSLNEIKRELAIYKEVVKEYPDLYRRIKEKIAEG